MSRNKGAAAERELAKLLGERLGLSLSRRLSQYQSGGHDLDGWDGVHIECKRYKRASQGDIAGWWQQALSQCSGGETPLLAYRADMQQWRFVLRPTDWGGAVSEPAEVDIDGLCAWVRHGQQLKLEVTA
jgi:Holliday junction resolvase